MPSRLDEIKERFARLEPGWDHGDISHQDAKALLAEVERLEKEMSKWLVWDEVSLTWIPKPRKEGKAINEHSSVA